MFFPHKAAFLYHSYTVYMQSRSFNRRRHNLKEISRLKWLKQLHLLATSSEEKLLVRKIFFLLVNSFYYIFSLPLNRINFPFSSSYQIGRARKANPHAMYKVQKISLFPSQDVHLMCYSFWDEKYFLWYLSIHIFVMYWAKKKNSRRKCDAILEYSIKPEKRNM